MVCVDGRWKGGLLLLYKTERGIERDRTIEGEREITETNAAHITKGESE